MAILMWPPGDGSKNTISINGRIYSASPGNSAAISNIDVNILEANGWTIYQTSAGQATVPIQTPAGVPTERFVVNGRVYVFLPGSTVNVNSFDYPILEANGFRRMTAAASGGAIPVNTGLPAITGTAQVGQTLTASTGTWTNAPTSFTYQWKANGTNIAGATASSYVSVTGDINKTITVAVTAINASGPAIPATSTATSAVIAGGGSIPINSGLPAISGTATVVQTLTASNGTWSNSPTSFTYQWQRGGVTIAGATASTYAIAAADTGKPITVAVTAINGSGSSAPATSAATSIVQPAIIPVPAGAIGVFSVVKTSIGGVPWAGNCLQVKRASDHTTLDIGWNGNVVDWVAADTFAAGSVLEVCIWYDQSGSGNNFVNATNDRAPLFQRESHWKGIRPLTGELLTNSANPRGLFVTWAGAPDQNAMTVYHVGAPRSSFENMMYFDGETAAFAGSRVNLADTQAATGLKYNRSGGGGSTSLCTVSQLGAVALSPTVADVNGTQVTFAAPASLSIPCMQIFSAVAGGGVTYDYLGDKFFFAVYPAAHDAATVAANRAAFLTNFAANTSTHTKEIIYGGNSMQVASRATKAKTLAWLSGFGRASEDDAGSPFTLTALPEWRVRNMGVSGRTLANEITNWTALGTNVVDTGLSRKIYVMGSATNDVNNSTYASTAAAQAAMDTLYTSMMSHVATVKAAGVDGVVIVTMIPITGAQLGTGNFREDARIYLNNKIRTNAVVNGYVVSDWCSVSPFDTQTGYTNTTYYFTDGIHPNDTGYNLIAPLDRAAILAA